MPDIFDYVTPVFGDHTFPKVSAPASITIAYWEGSGSVRAALVKRQNYWNQIDQAITDGLLTCADLEAANFKNQMAQSLNNLVGSVNLTVPPGYAIPSPPIEFEFPGTCVPNEGAGCAWVFERPTYASLALKSWGRDYDGEECVNNGPLSSPTFNDSPLSYSGQPGCGASVLRNTHAQTLYPDTNISMGPMTVPVVVSLNFNIDDIYAAWFPSCVVPPSPTINIYNFEKGDTTCANFSQIFNPFGIKWTR